MVGPVTLLMSLVIACNLQSILPAPVVEEADPFVGEWSALDPVDGSNMMLDIEQRDGAYEVLLLDLGATVCGLDKAGDPVFAAELESVGVVQGEVLRTSAPTLKCLSDPPTYQTLDLTMDYTYQHEEDTLFDHLQEVVWQRR